jgi:transcriptional regulator with XRE-family HTH domain
MTRTKQAAAVLVGALTVSSGAYALGTQASDGSATARTSASNGANAYGYGPGADRRGSSGRPFRGRGEGRGAGLEALAEKLGVQPATLQTALEGLKQDQAGGRERLAKAISDGLGIPESKVTAALDELRPQRGARPQGPPDEKVDALAKELGLDAAKVRAALEKFRPQRGPGRKRGDDHKQDLSALARELGVTEAKLRSALQAARPDRREERKEDRSAALAKELGVDAAKLQSVLDKAREQQSTAFVAGLAKRLNLTEDKVKAALDALPRRGVPGPGHP